MRGERLTFGSVCRGFAFSIPNYDNWNSNTNVSSHGSNLQKYTMRKFETYTQKKQIAVLVFALSMAMTEPDDKKAKVANIYAHAAQNYGRIHELREVDFELIKSKTIQDLLNI